MCAPLYQEMMPTSRRKKLVNNTSIPQHEIEAIARCLLPDILAFYESEEGQKEFARWKAEQEESSKTNNSKEGNEL